MKKITAFILTITLLISTFLLPMTAAASEITLKKRIDVTVNNKLKSNNFSISVRDTKTQKIIYERNGNKGIKPASNMKLITAAAALDKLGGNYQFLTELYVDGEIRDGVLNGDVYLRGQGDPMLMQKDLLNFAVALKKAGVKKVNGNLVGDATWFDYEFRMRGVVPEEEFEWYAPQIAALNLSPDTDYDTGTVIVAAAPSAKGKAAKITLTPKTGHVQIINKTKSVAKGSRNTVRIVRKYGTNTIVVSGNLPIGSSKKEYIAIQNPVRYTLDVMKLALASQGISIQDIKLGVVPKDATRISQKWSRKLYAIVEFNLKRSKNGMSEIFTKTLGRKFRKEGSFDAGIAVIKEYAASKGLDATKWKIADTSGLSHSNAITANEQTLLLWRIRQEPYFQTVFNGLPVAGNSSKLLGSSLRMRLTNPLTKGKVFAKTGYITGTNSLSGYMQAKSGQWYVFSILTEGSSYSVATNTIDEIVTIMAKEL